MSVLEAGGLQKRYGPVTAVETVSFEVSGGSMLGLLGPNGAGKTTTVSMIAGLLKPDAGEVRIDGRVLAGDRDPVKRKIGLVPQDLALYDELSANENLRLFGGLYDLRGVVLRDAMDRVLGLVGLADRAKDRVGTYSGGMKRRLNLAAALLHDPDILLLDEPTVGVDPQSRNAIFENLEELKRRGKALVYTTHYMEEVERLCDRVVIIDHGKVIANDTRQGLYQLLPGANVLQFEMERPVEGERLRSVPGVEWVEARGEVLRVGLRDLNDSEPVMRWLSEQGHRFRHVASERANLEAVFLTLTGRSLRDA